MNTVLAILGIVVAVLLVMATDWHLWRHRWYMLPAEQKLIRMMWFCCSLAGLTIIVAAITLQVDRG